MKIIYKYDLQITDKQSVEITGFESFLKVAEQNGKLCLWCIVNPDIKHVYKAEISIVGTGLPISYKPNVMKSNHLDSVVMSDGLVWHVFTN